MPASWRCWRNRINYYFKNEYSCTIEVRLQDKIYKIFFVTNFYTRSSPNGHSQNRTTLLTATLGCCVSKAILEVPHEIFSTFCGLFLLLIKRRDAGNILVSFQRRWTSIYYFLDSQIFDQVLDIFPWLSYWFTFIMLNVGKVDNLEFWYTINFFTLPSFTQTLQSRVITFFGINTSLCRFSFQGKLIYSLMDIHIQHLTSATLPNLQGSN